MANLEKLAIVRKDSFGAGFTTTCCSSLGIVSESALRLGALRGGRGGGTKRLALPLNPFDDPLADKAYATAGSCWRPGTRQPGSRGRRRAQCSRRRSSTTAGEQKAGAQGHDSGCNYAEALLASAIAQRADAAGRAARQRALAAAAEQLAGTSAEVRQLSDVAGLRARIAGRPRVSGS